MNDLKELREILPNYEIICIKNDLYIISTPYCKWTTPFSTIRKNIRLIKSIHDNLNNIVQFLELNDFTFDGYMFNRNSSPYIKAIVHVSSLSIHGITMNSIDDFYQVIREKLNLGLLSKPVIQNE